MSFVVVDDESSGCSHAGGGTVVVQFSGCLWQVACQVVNSERRRRAAYYVVGVFLPPNGTYQSPHAPSLLMCVWTVGVFPGIIIVGREAERGEAYGVALQIYNSSHRIML